MRIPVSPYSGGPTPLGELLRKSFQPLMSLHSPPCLRGLEERSTARVPVVSAQRNGSEVAISCQQKGLQKIWVLLHGICNENSNNCNCFQFLSTSYGLAILEHKLIYPSQFQQANQCYSGVLGSEMLSNLPKTTKLMRSRARV